MRGPVIFLQMAGRTQAKRSQKSRLEFLAETCPLKEQKAGTLEDG